MPVSLESRAQTLAEYLRVTADQIERGLTPDRIGRRLQLLSDAWERKT